MRLSAPALFLMLAAGTAPALPTGARDEQRQRAQAEAVDEIIVHRVKAGETLPGLAERWFVRPEDWRLAQALNRIKDPHKLPAGTQLRLRSSWIRTNPIRAELIAFRGEVRITTAGETRIATQGMTLGEGDLVETGANGFLTLGLPDESRVSLPSSSRIRLTRLRQVPMSDSIDRRFTLERGRSEARVTPMANPASRFLITTPVAVAAVRGTQFSVSYTPEEMKAATAVVEGKVGVTRTGRNAGMETLVRAGFGNIATGTGLSRAMRLLPAPPMEEPEKIQTDGAVTFRLKPVPGAVRYLVELAADAGFEDRIAAVEVTGTEAVFEGIEDGDLHVRVAAIDALGLVGQPAAFNFERRIDPAIAAAMSEKSEKEGEDGDDEKSEKARPDDLARDTPETADWFDEPVRTVSFLMADAYAGADDGLPPEGDVGFGSPDQSAYDDSIFSAFGVSAGARPSTSFVPIGGGSGGGSGGGWVRGGTSGETGATPGEPGAGEPGAGEPGAGNSGAGEPGSGDTGSGGTGGGSAGGGSDLPDGALPGETGGGAGSGSSAGSGATPDGSGETGSSGGPGDDDGSSGGVTVIPENPAPVPDVPGDGSPAVPGGGTSGGLPGGLPGGGQGAVPAAIPEPQTWLMLITGFGLVGFLMRRRRSGIARSAKPATGLAGRGQSRPDGACAMASGLASVFGAASVS
ncbi:FecR domain-containing protein [Sandaracinobacteroides sp. A072]|uniref:FecR domain-containing protein n=1 Tax=Sandaracinobacteroides sp. A072 TaxID=3461146 RepID=UPI004042B248